MASLHTIFNDIADIINDSSDKEVLRQKLKAGQFDWEKIVPVASNQLVIPLLYCQLKEKDLLHTLPEDLKSYLVEITCRNRERNQTILNEVHDISQLLTIHQIDHVFLKGAALLVTEFYQDQGERMVGDIDILVKPDQLFEAQDLLLKNGYKATETNFGSKYIEHKHLARLIPKTNLAAVEIHRKLLHKPVKGMLQPTKILDLKQNINGINIPSDADLLNHTVLNFEINDYGYYYNYLGLRNTYDAMILIKKINADALKTILKNKYMISFFRKVAIYYAVPQLNHGSNFIQFRKNIFLLKQKNKYIANFYYRFLAIYHFLSLMTNRLFLFINNKAYRNDALNDRKRILQIIQNRIKSL